MVGRPARHGQLHARPRRPACPGCPPLSAIAAARRARTGPGHPAADAGFGGARARPRQARAVPLPEDRRRCTSHSGRLPGQTQPPARPACRRGGIREGPPALQPRAAGDRGGGQPAPGPEGARAGAADDRRLRLLRPAAGGTGAGLRRPVADRVDGIRPRRAGPPGPGRGRKHRGFHPHRYAEGRGSRARAPRPCGAAARLDAAGMTLPAPAPSLYLVDASIYVFRAWHSLPDQFLDAQGWPTNAVHGFARFLLDLLERERPRHIAIAFDEALDSGFRHRLTQAPVRALQGTVRRAGPGGAGPS
ncbi:hypothetical protein G6F31_014038 [Rhizopus arrhizus]|nr:hypothetical protein G6F31_014038 [Rhizopus arrhizus]